MRLALLIGALLMSTPAAAEQKPTWSLVIHGGAGVIERARMTPEREKAARAGLDQALAAGEAVLARGGSAVDAVEAALHVLEDDPSFNAGRGAVFTYEGTNELDAAIMDGSNRAAGAVAGVMVCTGRECRIRALTRCGGRGGGTNDVRRSTGALCFLTSSAIVVSAE